MTRDTGLSPPLLLLVPPLLLDRRCWFRLLERLPAHVETAFVDLPPEAWTMDAERALATYEAALSDRIAREEGRRGLVVVGSSLGAYVGARALERAGGSVEHFVALSGLASLPPEVVRARSDLADQIERGDTSAPEVLRALPSASLGPEHPDLDLVAWLEATLGELTPEALVWALRLTSPLAGESRAVRSFATPATVLHGRRDGNVPFACGEELARRGRDARFVAFDTASHLLALTHAAEVATVLERLLALPRT